MAQHSPYLPTVGRMAGAEKAPFYLFEEERKAAAIFLGVGDS